jgi:hypothetical protein
LMTQKKPKTPRKQWKRNVQGTAGRNARPFYSKNTE